ncbi:hypothetical protein ACFW53_24795 [Nocardiopsis dassonvillei]|uniref:TRADD-N-associated membrane domain-containing protein n=1 Tax=Nocardiopsis dassonvillei TaxID=2014 RepID=UPI003672CA1A
MSQGYPEFNDSNPAAAGEPVADTTDRPEDGETRDLSGEQPAERANVDVDNSSVVVTGGVNTVYFTGHVETSKKEYPPPETLASARRKFHFKFLESSLTEARIAFVVSVAFTVVGCVIVLAGAVWALVNPDYLSLFTVLAGVLITGSSGVMALRAYKEKSHVTKQAEINEGKINKDDRWEKATSRIDQIENPELRDRLNATAAMQALGVTPDPETTADRVFADAEVIEPKEIEPDDSKP